MIQPQYPYKDDNGLIHDDKIKFYSDKGFQIIQKETDRIFDFAIDPYPSKYNYEETDVMVEESTNIIEEKALAYDIIMGVSE